MLLPDEDMVAISIIYRKMNLYKTEQAEAYGLSSSQVPIVIIVCRTPGISQNDIVKYLVFEKSVIAKSIGKLILSGYITREQNAKDKRAFNLFPTSKALSVYPLLIEQEKNCMSLLTKGMTAAEKNTLSSLLKKMVQNIT